MDNTASESNKNVKMAFKSMKGTIIYEMSDITRISAFRGVAAEKAKRFASLMLTSDELTKLLDAAIDGVNQRQDIAQAISILHEMKYRNSMICEENSLLELAYIYLLVEGEDIDVPSPEINKKKAELIRKESDLRAFFLSVALKLAGTLSLKQDADMLAYLDQVAPMVLKMNRHIQG